jgi:hypothetical protein
MSRWVAPLVLLAVAALAWPVLAGGPDAGATDSADAGAPGAGALAPNGAASGPMPLADAGAAAGKWEAASCVEHVPAGATRPVLREDFPTRGTSGWVADLQVYVTHGKGETVLPDKIRVQAGSDAAKALTDEGFAIPDPEGGTAPSLTTAPEGAEQVTKVTLPFVLLPKEPGRRKLVLPPVPIAVSRANGELVTVCTRPHAILVEDPIANEVDPKVKGNPPPRPQLEEWTFLEHLVAGLAAGLLLAAIIAWLVRLWLRRPKVVYVPPPRAPWVVALEELDEIRRSDLLADEMTGIYFDRVSDSVRKYLGARYGFDGLESTTDEMRSILRRVRPQVPEIKLIGAFLEDCDLVKFARVEPSEEDCLEALRRGETIVRVTIPPPVTRADAQKAAQVAS